MIYRSSALIVDNARIFADIPAIYHAEHADLHVTRLHGPIRLNVPYLATRDVVTAAGPRNRTSIAEPLRALMNRTVSLRWLAQGTMHRSLGVLMHATRQTDVAAIIDVVSPAMYPTIGVFADEVMRHGLLRRASVRLPFASLTPETPWLCVCPLPGGMTGTVQAAARPHTWAVIGEAAGALPVCRMLDAELAHGFRGGQQIIWS